MGHTRIAPAKLCSSYGISINEETVNCKLDEPQALLKFDVANFLIMDQSIILEILKITAQCTERKVCVDHGPKRSFHGNSEIAKT